MVRGGDRAADYAAQSSALAGAFKDYNTEGTDHLLTLVATVTAAANGNAQTSPRER